MGTRAGIAKAQAARLARGHIKRANGLSDREQAFVLHYLGAAGHNATEAYLMAGYKPKSRMHAGRNACEVRARPAVAAEIERLRTERNERLKVTADDVLRDIVKLKTDAELLPVNVQTVRARREIIKDLGEHVSVGAFKRQLGLSAPNGGPIETVDVAYLATLTDKELETLERARAILDRASGADAGQVPDGGGDSSGEGTAPQGE